MAPTAGTRLRFKQAKTKKHQPTTKKIPSLKNRIRALDRFLKRGGLDDATRANKQRELQQLQDEVGVRGFFLFFEKKGMTEQEKQNAEKYKKVSYPFVCLHDEVAATNQHVVLTRCIYQCQQMRFFERVKLMRKLKKAKAALEKADGAAEKQKYEQEFEKWRQELLYIFYYPKMEQYISLFPSNPHDGDKLKRQSDLRAAAIARFEKEQPLDAFHQFCYNDSGKASDGQHDASTTAAAAGASATKPASAAELLLKKPSKEEQKRKSKKPQSKKDKDAKKKKEVVVADLEDNEDVDMAKKAAGGDDDGEGEEEEEDDFFL